MFEWQIYLKNCAIYRFELNIIQQHKILTYQFVLLIASSAKKWREGGVGKSERGNSAKRFTGPEF